MHSTPLASKQARERETETEGRQREAERKRERESESQIWPADILGSARAVSCGEGEQASNPAAESRNPESSIYLCPKALTYVT